MMLRNNLIIFMGLLAVIVWYLLNIFKLLKFNLEILKKIKLDEDNQELLCQAQVDLLKRTLQEFNPIFQIPPQQI